MSFTVDRSVLICATRATVFSFFTDPARWADWWGAGSTVDGRPGGALLIRYPNGDTASGHIVELDPPARVVFTFGYDKPGKPIAPGGSRVVVTLEERPAGTLLTLLHEVADPATSEEHVAGWRFQLSLFAVAAARVQHDPAAAADRWFAAWAETDPAARRAALAAACTADVVLRDNYACIEGMAELDAHIAAAQRHMPGQTMQRAGEPRHCQGTAVVPWTTPKSSGHNVFDFAPDGRIARVVGLWRAP